MKFSKLSNITCYFQCGEKKLNSFKALEKDMEYVQS